MRSPKAEARTPDRRLDGCLVEKVEAVPNHDRVAHLCLAAITILLVCPAAASGCTSLGPAREPQKITFVYTYPGPPDPYAAHYQAWVEAFEEQHPLIVVELAPWNEAYYGSEVTDRGDVFLLPDTSIDALNLIERDLIMSLSPYVDGDPNLDSGDFYPGVMASLGANGETWAVPAAVDPTVLFYNKDLFDLVGRPYPEAGWTWDEFLVAAQALRDPDNGVYGYVPTDAARDAALLIYQHGGRLIDDFANPTQATLDEPLNIEALDWYALLSHEDAYDVAPTSEQVFRDFRRPESRPSDAIFYPSRTAEWRNYGGIQSGQAGMWIGELSQRKWLHNSTDGVLRWGVAPLPLGSQPAVLARVWGYLIASNTSHPDACWTWISFLSKQAPPESALIPARRSVATALHEASGDEVYATGQEALLGLVSLSAITWSQVPRASAEFDRAVQSVVGHSMHALEALTEAQLRLSAYSHDQE